MSIYKQFKTNKAAEEEGIIVKFQANDDGTIPSFKIGRTSQSNVKWLKTFEAKTRPYKKDIAAKAMSEEEAHKLNVDIFVSAILQGWENIQDEKGKNIPFTAENATKLLNDLPELYATLNEHSSKMENFLEANLKDDEKN